MKEQKNELMWSHIYWLGMLGTTGSYTAAARRLGVSKGAVSLRIAELEQVSGVALAQRTTRSVRLTEAGQALVDSTRTARSEERRIGKEFVRSFSPRWSPSR